QGAERLQAGARGRTGPQHCVIRARGAGDARDLPEAIDGDGLAEGAARKGAEVLHGDTRGCHGPQRGVSHARGRSGAAAHHLSTVIDAQGLAQVRAWEGAEVLRRDPRGRHGPQRGMVLARGRDVAEARDLPAGIDPESVAEVPAQEGAKISDAARYGGELRTRRDSRGCCRLPGIPAPCNTHGREEQNESSHLASSVLRLTLSLE